MKLFVATMLSFVLVCLSFTSSTNGEEPAERFLDALRQNGYNDLALDYLNSLENSDLVGPEFKKRIPFEKAELLIEDVARSKDSSEWEAKLNEAEKLLEQYAAGVTEADLIAKSKVITGNLARGRARIYQRKSEADLLTAKEKEELVAKSREMLNRAKESYNSAKSTLREYLKGYQVDPADPNSEKKLRSLRAQFTRIRYYLPVLNEQLADTYPKGSSESAKLLTQAVVDYKDVADDYRRYRAGLEAGLGAARCEFKMGRIDECLLNLEQFFELQPTPTTRDLRRSAILLATQCWEQKDPYPFQEIITVCEPSVGMLSKQQLRNPDWLAVQLALAKSYKAKGEYVGQEKKPGVNAQVRALNKNAVKLAKAVARTRTTAGESARELLADWNLKIAETEEVETGPMTFVDARQKGQDVVSEIELVLQEIADLSGKPDQQAELSDARQRLASQVEEAMGYFETAMSMTTGVEREEINRIRYYQSFCHFAVGRYLESVVIGEFLLNKYPNVNWTRQSCGLALRSYAQLLARVANAEHQFEANGLTELATRTIELYPGSKESDLAARMGMISSLNDNDIEAAESYFSKLGDTSPARISLASQLGRKLWFDYLRNRAVDPSNAVKLVPKAKKYLEIAVTNANVQDLDIDMAKSSLFLVDAYLVLDEVDTAAATLSRENIGPLDVVKNQSPKIVNSPTYEAFKKDVYTIAVKTYLAQIRTGKNVEAAVRNANGVIAGLQADARKSADRAEQDRLNRIYRMIATELKSSFEGISDNNAKKAFGQTISTFLGAIEQNATDGPTVLWAGSTLLSIADALVEQGMDEDAKPVFRQAVSALSRAEKIGFQNQPNAAALATELKRQRALAERGSGNYEKALDQFAEILTEKPTRLGVQLDAAKTLHMWGKATSRSKPYAEAMMGARKSQAGGSQRAANVIWGWLKIYKATNGKEKFAEQFNYALYHLIEARFEYGVLENNQRAIKSAMNDLVKARKRDPEMGGPVWKQKYTELERRIKTKLK